MADLELSSEEGLSASVDCHVHIAASEFDEVLLLR